MEDDETLPAKTIPDRASGPAEALASPELGLRYDLGTVLGRGGMGEVRLARDKRIDREVAVKQMHAATSDESATSRFFREAHVQGSLEHPAVVPIYDLGIDAGGKPFIVMKRLAGTTLHDVLAANQWKRGQLLARLVDVCQAIDCAHDRGIVHRDLKPSNIMFGKFGETYVLDWGLARSMATSQRPVQTVTEQPKGGETLAGDLLGTPGYMPPEQARGEVVGPPADVFALGVILFEILAGKPALPRGMAAIGATLEATCHRPGEHADVPLELDELCARATAADPRERPTTRELADKIQAYLDGDRDTLRRCEMARKHAREARVALDSGDNDDATRANALHFASKALALDAGNADGQAVFQYLILQAPKTIPPEAVAAADEARGKTRRTVLRMAAYSYLGMIGAIGILTFLPVNAMWLLGITMLISLLTGAVALYMSRTTLPMRTPWFLLLLGLNCLLIAMSGVIFTPLFVMPVFLVGSLGTWMQQPTTYSPAIMIAFHLAPLVILLALETLGIIPSTFHVEHGQLVFTPWVIEMTPTVTLIVFAVLMVSQIASSTVVVLANRLTAQIIQNRLHAQELHLQRALQGPADTSRP